MPHPNLVAIANDLLGQNPGPVVRYRLLRDVLQRPAHDPELARAKAALDESHGVRELAAEQWPDGSWGAFHSQASRRKQKIITTEMGVERALALGLDASHPILQKAANYIIQIMKGEFEFPDRQEKNDRWQMGKRLFLASTLSLIHSDHPLLEEDRTSWLEIARRTFQSGAYREEDEIRAHIALTGATVKDSYLVLNGKYQLNLLGFRAGALPPPLEQILLQWLWERPDGIGYLNIPLKPPPPQQPGPLDRWLASLEMLARLFPAAPEIVGEAFTWLWEKQNEQGYWDFGPRPASITYLPLYDSWRKRQNRTFDWTTRVLALLSAIRSGKTTPR
ncbi:MAG: hypothetical protein U9R25_11920 [Chloroflexota bacterium]|nr:hypothetical protein [Chloroflexota bacterium]